MKSNKINNILLLNNHPIPIPDGRNHYSDMINNMQKDYYELMELLPEIIFELDTDGCITYINKRVTEYLGFPRDELIGVTPEYLVKKEERERVRHGIQDNLNGEDYIGVKYNFLKRDGSSAPFLVNTCKIIKDSVIVGIRGFAVSLTSETRAERALHEVNELFSVIAEQTLVGISIVQDGEVIFVNDYIAHILGYTVSELKNLDKKNFFDLVHKDDKHKLIQYFVNHNTNEIAVLNNIQYRIIDKNGELKWIELWSKAIKYHGQETIFSLGIDITEKKNTEKALQDNEEKFQSLIENSSEVIGIFDANGVIQFGSQSLPRMLGFTPEEMIGTYVFDYVHSDDQERLLNLFADAIKGLVQKINLEFRCKHKDGSWRDMATTASNLLDDPVIKGVVINLRDITDQKRAEEKANFYEFYDSLTNLPNREMFLARLDVEIKKAQTSRRKSEKEGYIFAVMCLGIDKFKNINDMYGPVIGDKLLQKVGKRLKKNFRDNDLVSRYGGDTYMILFSDIGSYDDAVEIILKTLDIFSDPYVIEDNVFKITSSMGVCFYPHDGYNKELLVKNSESAMYMAKEQGRNTYRLFDAKMNTEMLTRLQVEKELENAIIHNHFKAYYQPKYDNKGRLTGMESLIRWISSKDGELIFPSSFIDVAEKNGMIIDIGNIILYESCAQNKKWQDMGYPAMRVAVNISPVQFKQPNLVSNIQNILNQTDLDPEYLELEITESGIMENEKDSIKKLNELHDLGVRITIDDFGTGYSSLSKLKDYPIDTLKIDKSFVENLPNNEKSSTITTTIIDLAHNLDFRVVAEGVETKDQLDFLIKHNCDQYQGYFFSKPLPPEEFEEKLKAI